MKNVHILPTSKPSRLYKSKITQNISMGPIDISQHGDATYNLNIYITSDEEIVLNGYHFNSKYGDEPQKTNQRDIDSRKYWEEEDYYISKIILTTDQDLIKDGVQDIDDEFLEWFVKNPSCEFVEVVKYDGYLYKKYMVITSQEEADQDEHYLDSYGCTKNEFELSLNFKKEESKQEPCDNCNNDVCCCIIRKQETLEEPKKLTVEKALLLMRNAPMTFVPNKRLYSEEEVLELIWKYETRKTSMVGYDNVKKWFEQFKKK
jgi:hypothetical protein